MDMLPLRQSHRIPNIVDIKDPLIHYWQLAHLKTDLHHFFDALYAGLGPRP